MKGKFVRYADCIPVKGANRSVICDLRRHEYKYIPNSLYDILVKFQGETVYKIKEHHQHAYDDIIDEYVEFLVDNEYVFFDENPENFLKLNENFYSPSIITNCIIDIEKDIPDFKSIFKGLHKLNCKALQIRFYSHMTLGLLKSALSELKNMKTSIISVEVYFPWSSEINIKKIQEIMFEYPRLLKVFIYRCNEDKLIKTEFNDSALILKSTKKNICITSCGVIKNSFFSTNVMMYTEALNHNSCLNRKISIDINGDIKNCPSMPESYGNIKDTTLEEAIEKPGFKKYWNITKDDIEVCRDCEFRYICTDCRAYTERTTFNKEGLDLSKPLKCGYNPYTNEWAEWSTNPLKQKAITYYGMEELVKKNED